MLKVGDTTFVFADDKDAKLEKPTWELSDDELAEQFIVLRKKIKELEARLAFVKERIIGGIEDGVCFSHDGWRVQLREFQRPYFRASEALKSGDLSREVYDRHSNSARVRELYLEGKDENED